MKKFPLHPHVLLSALLLPFLFGFSGVSLDDIQTAFLNNEYEKAGMLSRALLDQNPPGEQAGEARYYLALSQLYLGDTAGGRQNFQRVIDQNPSRPLRDRARLGIIDSYLLAEEYEDALMRGRELLGQSPDSESLSLIYLKIARAHLKLTNWSEARDYLNKLIREFPDSLEAHLARQLLAEEQYFAVQVGSFLDRERSEKLVEELKGLKEYAYIVETVDYSGRKFYRVRVGQISSLPEAELLKKKLTHYGYPTRIYP